MHRTKFRFSNRALMSSSHCLWHITGRVLAWVKLLFAVGSGTIQPLQALVRRCGEPCSWACFMHSGTLRLHPDHVHAGTLLLGSEALLFHDLAPSVLQRNGTSSSHMRCRMTASLRATAMTARRWPRVLASFMPQALSGDHVELRVSSTLAAV